MKKFLGEEYTPVDWDGISTDKLAGMLETCDRDLVISFAVRIIKNPEEHRYDEYDETRVHELPLPSGYTFDEAQGRIDDFKDAVKKLVDKHYKTNHYDKKVKSVFDVLTEEWMTCNKVRRLVQFGYSETENLLENVENQGYNMETARVLHVDGGDFKIYRRIPEENDAN